MLTKAIMRRVALAGAALLLASPGAFAAGEVALDLELLPLELGDRLSLGERLRHRLAVHLVERRLVVERLEVRRSARHAEEDHALGARRMVGLVGVEHRPERGRAEAQAGLGQELVRRSHEAALDAREDHEEIVVLLLSDHRHPAVK